MVVYLGISYSLADIQYCVEELGIANYRSYRMVERIMW